MSQPEADAGVSEFLQNEPGNTYHAVEVVRHQALSNPEPDLSENTAMCKCKVVHVREPKKTAAEQTRLICVMCSEECKPFLEILNTGLSRAQLDDRDGEGRKDPFIGIGKVFNSEKSPVYPFSDDVIISPPIYNLGPPIHTRSPIVLKGWYNSLKASVTEARVNWGNSGQNSGRNKWSFCDGNKLVYIAWVCYEKCGILDGVVRTLPDDAQGIDGVDEGEDGASTPQPPKRKRDSTTSLEPRATEGLALTNAVAAKSLEWLMRSEAPTQVDPASSKKETVDVLLKIGESTVAGEDTKDFCRQRLDAIARML
jgi:hypothetical protein